LHHRGSRYASIWQVLGVSEAHKVAALWWQWGTIEPPADVVRQISILEGQTATKVPDAVAEFLKKKRNEKAGPAIITHTGRFL